jgi:hypothetical protein
MTVSVVPNQVQAMPRPLKTERNCMGYVTLFMRQNLTNLIISKKKRGKVCILKSKLFSSIAVWTTPIEQTGVVVRLKNCVPEVPRSNLHWIIGYRVPGRLCFLKIFQADYRVIT